MKPRTFCLIGLLLVGISCHQGRQVKPSAAAWPGISDSAAAGILGSYSGPFRKGLLILVVNYVSGNTVSGYDLNRGIRRNLNGTVEEKDGRFTLVLQEPGGSRYDGTFYLSIDSPAQRIGGNWVPADSSLIHSSALTLARLSQSGTPIDEFYDHDWNSELGTLTFEEGNTCNLEYYPERTDDNPNPQRIMINGNFIRNGDTILIDWQNNKLTPAPQMQLIYKKQARPRPFGSDSVIFEILHGNGVEFDKSV
jgi:hypothetical protein